MNAIRIVAIIKQDGELHLTNIPCRKGDRVEVIVMVLENAADRARREEALKSLLKHAGASTFCTTGKYPKRDELYDRSI